MLKKIPRGVILLYTVLLLGIASVIALAVVSQASLGSFLDANTEIDALEARAEIMGCVDEFIIQVQKDADYAPATLSTGSVTCDLTVTPNGTTRSGLLTLTEGDITRGVRVDVETSPFSVTQITETLE